MISDTQTDSTDCTPSKKKHIDDKDESVCVSLIIKISLLIPLFSSHIDNIIV